MADPLSIVASIVGIAAAGVKVSISLYALAETVKTAGKRIQAIANDISSTCGILNQIRDLIDPKPLPDGTNTSFFTKDALRDIATALSHCDTIFTETHAYLERASRQLKSVRNTAPSSQRSGPPPLRASAASVRRRASRANNPAPVEPESKIELSHAERAKWPFLQPQFDELRADLRDAKSNLLLMVAVSHLALASRGAAGQEAGRVVDKKEEMELKATIVRLKRGRTMGLGDPEKGDGDGKEKEKEKERGIKLLVIGFKRLFGGKEGSNENQKKVGARGGGLGLLSADGRAVGGDGGGRVPSERPQKLNAIEKEPPAPNTTNPDSQLDKAEADKHINDPDDHNLDTKAQTVNHLGSKDKESPAKSPVSDPESTMEAGHQDHPEPQNSGDRQMHLFNNALSSDHVLIDEQPSSSLSPSNPTFPIEFRPRPRSPSPPPPPRSKYHAWTTSALTGLHSGRNRAVTIHEIVLSAAELSKIVNVEGHENLLTSLGKLNMYQRQLVLAHVSHIDSVLVHVELCESKDRVPTVFGELDVESLVWVTMCEDGGLVVFELDDFFGPGTRETRELSERERRRAGREAEIARQELLRARREEELRREVEQARREMERERLADMHLREVKRVDRRERRRHRAGAIGESQYTESVHYRDESPKEERIKVQDDLGRTHTFPYHQACTWERMYGLISTLDTRIARGNFDILGPNGKVIHPHLWDSLVRPGWNVSIKLHDSPKLGDRRHDIRSGIPASQLSPPPPSPPPHRLPSPGPRLRFRRPSSLGPPRSQSFNSSDEWSYDSTSSLSDLDRMLPSRRARFTRSVKTGFKRLKRAFPPILMVSTRAEELEAPKRYRARSALSRTHPVRAEIEVAPRVQRRTEGAEIPGLEPYRGVERVDSAEAGSEEGEEEREREVNLTDEQLVNGLMSKWIQGADTKAEEAEGSERKGKGKLDEDDIVEV